MKLLLDAHALVWALAAPERLPEKVGVALKSNGNQLFVSYATLWELANKVAAQRLPLLGASAEEISRAIEELGVSFVEITRDDILASAMLPRHHADPFDRMLIAQARARSLTLVSKDTDVARYDAEILWT